jgi:hypothetical protein
MIFFSFTQSALAELAPRPSCQEVFSRSFFDREVPAPKSQLLQGWVRQSLLWRKSPAFLVESIEHPSQYTLVSADRPDYPLFQFPEWEDRPIRAVGGSIDQIELKDNRLKWSRSWALFEPNEAKYSHIQETRHFKISFDSFFDIAGRRLILVHGPDFAQTQPKVKPSDFQEWLHEFPQGVPVASVEKQSDQFLIGYAEGMTTAWILERSTKSILKLSMEGQAGFNTQYTFKIGHGNMRIRDFGRTFVFQDKVLNLEILGEKIILRKAEWKKDQQQWSEVQEETLQISRKGPLFVPHWNEGYEMFHPMKVEESGKLVVLLKNVKKVTTYSFLQLDLAKGLVSMTEEFVVPRLFVPRVLMSIPNPDNTNDFVFGLFDQAGKTLVFPKVFP